MSVAQSRFGEMTIGDCLGRLERRRAETLANRAAVLSGVADVAIDRCIDDLDRPQITSDEDPERWDGLS